MSPKCLPWMGLGWIWTSVWSKMGRVCSVLVACVILWQLSCCMLTTNLTNPVFQLTSVQNEVLESQGLNVLCKALWNPWIKDVVEMKAFYGFSWFVLLFFNRTSHPKEWQSLFGWPGREGFVSVKPQNQKKTFCREQCAVLKTLDDTGGAALWCSMCMLGLNCWEHKQKRVLLLCLFFLT